MGFKSTVGTVPVLLLTLGQGGETPLTLTESPLILVRILSLSEFETNSELRRDDECVDVG